MEHERAWNRVFSVQDALAHGMSRGELRGSRFIAPIASTRIDAEIARTRPWHELVREAHDAVRADDQFFSHTTAARIHGMPLPHRLRDEDVVHVAAPEGGNRTRKGRAIAHRLRAEVTMVDGFAVETVADTIVHLATLLSERELVQVIDWALSPQRKEPLTKESLVDRLEHFKGARGIPRLKRAIAAARVGSESPMESVLRLIAADGGFPEPRLNLEVRDAKGAFVARVDLAWPERRIALEYDGDHHRTDAAQFAHDAVRIEHLHMLGWIVIRVTKEHLRDPGRDILPRLSAAFERSLAVAT